MTNAAYRSVLRSLGQELRLARKARGWTQPDLVAKLQVKIRVNTYACYEQGIRACPLLRLLDICDVLGLSVSDLLDRALRRLVDPPVHLPESPQVGDPVLAHGTIIGIDEGVALVEVYRSWPLGMRVPVQCGALEYNDAAAAGDGGGEAAAVTSG